MKTSILIIPAAAAILCMSSFAPGVAAPNEVKQATYSTQTTAFAFLRTHPNGKGITATWGMATASRVLEFSVQRTYEDPSDTYAYWEDLAVIPNNAKRSCTYADTDVFPGIVSYRIVALFDDGSTETSEISSVRIRSRH